MAELLETLMRQQEVVAALHFITRPKERKWRRWMFNNESRRRSLVRRSVPGESRPVTCF